MTETKIIKKSISILVAILLAGMSPWLIDHLPGKDEVNLQVPAGLKCLNEGTSEWNRALPEMAEVPTLLTGDTWSYETNLDISGTFYYDGNPLELEGTVYGENTFTVVELVSTFANGTEYLCYKVDHLGEYTIDMSGFIINIEVIAYTNGSEYRHVGDLALVKNDMFHTGQVIITSYFGDDTIDFNLTQNETYFGAKEDYDFPVIVNEEWNQTLVKYSNHTGNFGNDFFDESVSEDLKVESHCVGREVKNVAGSYLDTYTLNINQDQQINYYSPATRNLAYVEYSSGSYLSLQNLTVEIQDGNTELMSYDIHDFTQGRSVDMDIPFGIAPNTELVVQGNIQGYDDGSLNIDIGKIGTFTDIPVIDGHFQAGNITLGVIEDDTPSSLDIGSHGIFVYYDDFILYGVVSLTIGAPDARIFQNNISLDPAHGAFLNSRVNISLNITNPSLIEMTNVSLQITSNETLLISASDISIGAMSQCAWVGEFTVLLPVGTNEVTVLVDSENRYEETYENNNEATISYEVFDRPTPAFTELVPGEQNYSIMEGESQLFRAIIDHSPGANYNMSWWLKGILDDNYSQLICSENVFNFSTTYSGMYSSENSPFKLKFHVVDEAVENHHTENHYQWNVDVENTNRLPIIDSFSPSIPVESIAENEEILFNISAHDLDGDDIVFTWRLDGEIINISGQSYNYYADYNSNGSHTLITYLNDSHGSISLSWTFLVENTNQQCSANIALPIIIDYVVGETIKFSGEGSSDPDVRPEDIEKDLFFQWSFGDGKDAQGMKVEHTYSNFGSYEVELLVTDNLGCSSIATMVIHIKEAETPTEDDDEGENNNTDDKGETSENEVENRNVTITIIAFIVIGMVILLFVWFSLEVKKKKRIGKAVNELVMLEENREIILNDIDKVQGRLEQLEWDLEDKYISQEKYRRLVHKYRRALEKLRDELVYVEEDLEEKENIIERPNKRKDTGRRMYGGWGNEDYNNPSYQDIDEWHNDCDESSGNYYHCDRYLDEDWGDEETVDDYYLVDEGDGEEESWD